MRFKFTLFAILFLAMTTYVSNASAEDPPAGWAICDVVRIGSNDLHGWAYLELRHKDDAWGRSVIFAVDQDIRKEALAIALTALSNNINVRVLISNERNVPLHDPSHGGYQTLKAVYTYTP